MSIGGGRLSQSGQWCPVCVRPRVDGAVRPSEVAMLLACRRFVVSEVPLGNGPLETPLGSAPRGALVLMQT